MPALTSLLTQTLGPHRVDDTTVQATEEALAEVVRARIEVRRLQNSVRARYHKFMRTASAADVALFHSHNDGIRFIAWIFAFIKVCKLLPCVPSCFLCRTCPVPAAVSPDLSLQSEVWRAS